MKKMTLTKIVGALSIAGLALVVVGIAQSDPLHLLMAEAVPIPAARQDPPLHEQLFLEQL